MFKGLWTDSQMAPLERIVKFAHAQGTTIGIQLAHAGRKSSTLSPWVHLNAAKTHRATTYVAQKDEGGWPDEGKFSCDNVSSVFNFDFGVLVVSASEIPYSDQYPKPRPLTADELLQLDDAFLSTIERCKKLDCESFMYFMLDMAGV